VLCCVCCVLLSDFSFIGLTALEMCLVVAMKEFKQLEVASYNFEMAWAKFMQFQKNGHFMQVKKGVGLKVNPLSPQTQHSTTLTLSSFFRPLSTWWSWSW